MTTGPDVDQDQAPVPVLSPEVARALAAAITPDVTANQEAAKRKQAAEDLAAPAPGGPCSRCGAVESWERPGVGGWAGGDAHGAVCHACDRERGGPAGDDRQHRIRVARQVLRQTPAPPWAAHGDTPAARWWHDDYLAAAMPWWYELPGAPAGRGAERFGYLTGPELVARLYEGREPQPPVLHSRGRRHRCGGCGAKGKVWQVEQVGVPAAIGSDGELSRTVRAHFRITWTCHRCRHTDVEQRPDQLPNVPVRMAVG